jgi:prevent-host-death family protein
MDHSSSIEIPLISASAFKARCSQVIDEVARGRRSVVITKRGRPVAKLVPVDEGTTSLFGFAKGAITVHGDIVGPLEVEWEAAR